MSQQILSITQINEYIKNLVDSDPRLISVAVRGEVSNYKVYPSGHHYFTLKDESSALKCVMFRGNAMRLRFKPVNGMQILAMGSVSVYARDGAYQLYCSNLIPDGVGDLFAAFEQLKTKLANEGLFDASHKKALPQYPERIGIITSSAGAAVHDMLRILNKRYPLSRVYLLPVRVQGQEAPEEIAAALHYANRFRLADLLIVGRGGGSIEDLWAFNDQRVAYAIYESKIPVISAVGHEPDVTISDFVSDLRAATPSNAAELAVPDQNVLRQNIDSMAAVIINVLHQKIKTAARQLQLLSASPVLQSTDHYFRQKASQLELLNNRLLASETSIIQQFQQQFAAVGAKLDALSPLKVLSRGYSMVRDQKGNVLRSVKGIKIGENVQINMGDGVVSADVTNVKENVE